MHQGIFGAFRRYGTGGNADDPSIVPEWKRGVDAVEEPTVSTSVMSYSQCTNLEGVKEGVKGRETVGNRARRDATKAGKTQPEDKCGARHMRTECTRARNRTSIE